MSFSHPVHNLDPSSPCNHCFMLVTYLILNPHTFSFLKRCNNKTLHEWEYYANIWVLSHGLKRSIIDVRLGSKCVSVINEYEHISSLMFFSIVILLVRDICYSETDMWCHYYVMRLSIVWWVKFAPKHSIRTLIMKIYLI